MEDLREELGRLAGGRVCLLGLGSAGRGDDGFGVRLAGDLERLGVPGVVVAGTDPERHIARVAEAGYDHVVLLDAVDFGGAPGSAVWLGGGAIAERYPQVSTHRLSLGLLARLAESGGLTRAWLLGVQPQSLAAGERLSPPVAATLAILRDWLLQALAAKASP